MTVGLSAANLANPWLDVLRLQGITAKTVIGVKLHTGDPGASGTTAASGNTTRATITFAAAAAGAIASNNAPAWAAWPVGQNGEVISHISLWDSTSAGNFLCSIALTASKTMGTGDTLTLTSGGTTVTLTPIAA
jgi:hypothetical protein